MRSDMRRNRRRLVEAGLDLLAQDPHNTTMADIARHAEVSTATAYRHFASIDQLIGEVVAWLVEGLRDYSLASAKTGKTLIEDVMGYWVRQVLDYGSILVALRSQRGYIERLENGDPTIGSTSQAWRRPIREYLELSSDGVEMTFSLMLLNQLSDPRDIRDLHENVGLDPEQIVRTIVSTFEAAVTPWMHQLTAAAT